MRGLRRRIWAPFAPPPGAIVPRWIAIAFLLMAAALVPWIAFLLYELPDHQVANHWALAWGGFDVGLGLALLATGVAILRRSALTEVAATVAGTLLVADAWFDVLTSRGTTEVGIAIAEAVLVELPLAGLCFWIARNVERVLEDAARRLARFGYRISSGRLVPPDRPVREETPR